VNDYTVYLERVFRGPMDLLLHLVREQEVEIHEIEISRVIEGYTAYLEAMQSLDIELAGEFLVMAATLMTIKSRSLLPREEIDLEDELDPKDELIQRLLEYRRFKEASDTLARGLANRQLLHPRGAFPELAEEAQEDEEPMLDLGDLSAWDLLSTFSRLMRETLANRPMSIAGDARPMRYYVTNLARAVRAGGRMTLSKLLLDVEENPTKETLVGAFCAMLELIRLGIVTVEQGEKSGEIDICLARDAIEDVDQLLDGTTFEDELLPSADEPKQGEEAAEELEREPGSEPVGLEAGKSGPTS
jgi:segregation and condensation protein A